MVIPWVYGSTSHYSRIDGRESCCDDGVARVHVGPFFLSLGDQTSCVGSPDVQELFQLFNKRLCTPILS